MTTDKYLDRVYRPGMYNCLHFSVEVWQDLTGQNIRELLDGLLTGRLGDRALTRTTREAFTLSDSPIGDQCLVLMQHARSAPHIGVWLRGKVLHIQRSGVQYMPLHVVSLGFSKVRFFVPCHD